MTGRFTICGMERSHDCVVDGDTFRLGDRRLRLVGVDAPELDHAACPQEAALAVKARDRLRDILNGGPLTMIANPAERTDRYGRELVVVERSGRNVGEQLIDAGLAHRYARSKRSWCR